MDVTAEPAQSAAGAQAGIGVGVATDVVAEPTPGGTPENPAIPASTASPESPESPAVSEPVAASVPRFRIVTVVSVTVALPDQFPTIVLEDVEEHHRQLAFRVGMAEGVAIAAVLEQRPTPRPLTHDLFAEALERFSVDVLAVRLMGRVGATYLAELQLSGARGREVLSCRPSDGIALALRRRVAAPILADERLFMEVGDVLPYAGPPPDADDPADAAVRA
jgi:hypothetical protein